MVPYGEAGDCYSTANCPQGKFSINLTGTGLRVAAYTGWIGVGNRPSLWLQRIQDNQVVFGKFTCAVLSNMMSQVIYGKCGGYCGTCEPEHHKVIVLVVSALFLKIGQIFLPAEISCFCSGAQIGCAALLDKRSFLGETEDFHENSFAVTRGSY